MIFLPLIGLTMAYNVIYPMYKNIKQNKVIKNKKNDCNPVETSSTKTDGLSSFYLVDNEFSAQFGNDVDSFDSYVKDNSGKLKIINFKRLKKQNCPVLEYILAANEIIHDEPTRGYSALTKDNILLNTKTVASGRSNSALKSSEVTNQNVQALLDKYEAKKVIKKQTIAGEEVYTVDAGFSSFTGNYCVEAGGVKWLGNVNVNHNSEFDSNVQIYGKDSLGKIKISNDGEFNKKVTEMLTPKFNENIITNKNMRIKASQLNDFISSTLTVPNDIYKLYLASKQEYDEKSNS